MPSTFPDQEFADRPEGRESREKRVQLIFARAPKQKIMRVSRDDLTALGRCPVYPPIISEFVRRTTDQRASADSCTKKQTLGAFIITRTFRRAYWQLKANQLSSGNDAKSLDSGT